MKSPEIQPGSNYEHRGTCPFFIPVEVWKRRNQAKLLAWFRNSEKSTNHINQRYQSLVIKRGVREYHDVISNMKMYVCKFVYMSTNTN